MKYILLLLLTSCSSQVGKRLEKMPVQKSDYEICRDRGYGHTVCTGLESGHRYTAVYRPICNNTSGYQIDSCKDRKKGLRRIK